MNEKNKKEIVDYLQRLKSIYLAIDNKMLSGDITKLDDLVRWLQTPVDTVTEESSTKVPMKKKKKPSFKENYVLLKKNDLQNLNGTNLNYEEFSNIGAIERYIEDNAEDKIIKQATAIDLKLLYCLLTNDEKEMKGTKKVIFRALKQNVLARKRGTAFSQNRP